MHLGRTESLTPVCDACVLLSIQSLAAAIDSIEVGSGGFVVVAMRRNCLSRLNSVDEIAPLRRFLIIFNRVLRFGTCARDNYSMPRLHQIVATLSLS